MYDFLLLPDIKGLKYTLAGTIKELIIFIIIVIFSGVFLHRNRSQVGKMCLCCLQLGIQCNYGRNYCNYNDLIRCRGGSVTPAMFGLNIFMTIVYSH